MMLAMILQESSAIERAMGGLNPLSITFMAISMGGVTLLAVWCFARILNQKKHFDPDGTGPAKPPVGGSADPTD